MLCYDTYFHSRKYTVNSQPPSELSHAVRDVAQDASAQPQTALPVNMSEGTSATSFLDDSAADAALPVSTHKKPELLQIPFSQILGIDPVLEKRLTSVGIDLPLSIDVEAWNRDALISYLNFHPPLVRQSTSGYFCIGGFRRFRLAQALFSGQPCTPIFVLCRPGKLSTAARQHLLCMELFAAPAISRTDRSEAPQLYDLWRKLGSDISIIKGNTDQNFDLAMGFESRNKKKNGIPITK
jgi:hypothetical protein